MDGLEETSLMTSLHYMALGMYGETKTRKYSADKNPQKYQEALVQELHFSWSICGR